MQSLCFKKFPNMVILGGCGGYTIDFDDKERIANVHPDEQCTNFKFVHCVDRCSYVDKQKICLWRNCIT